MGLQCFYPSWQGAPYINFFICPYDMYKEFRSLWHLSLIKNLNRIFEILIHTKYLLNLLPSLPKNFFYPNFGHIIPPPIIWIGSKGLLSQLILSFDARWSQQPQCSVSFATPFTYCDKYYLKKNFWFVLIKLIN